MFIQRQYNRTEHDDFVLNVQPHLRDNKEAVPQYYQNQLVGWKIQNQYD